MRCWLCAGAGCGGKGRHDPPRNVRRESAGLPRDFVQGAHRAEEAAHDFLWRIHKAVPEYGDIGIFNRSHYEDVLMVRVHKLVPKEVWSKRYEQINEFETIPARRIT